MKCISCGAEVSGAVLGSLIKCDYCGTTNSFVSRVKIEIDSSNSNLDSRDKQKLQTALSEIEQGEYEDALGTLEHIASKEDRIATIYANMALCRFWLGKDDFSHLTDVTKLLRKASLANEVSVEIAPFIRSVVFNTAKICSLEVRYGSDLDNCILALAKTVELVPDYPDRDDLLTEFVKLNTQSLVRDAWVHIKRDKKNFDAPRTLVLSLVNLVALSAEANQEATALAIICLNQKGNKFSDVSQSVIASVREGYTRFFGKTTEPKIVFSIFSGPKIII